MYKLKSFLVIAALMAATVAQAQVKKPAETEVKQMSHTQVLFENMLQATQKLLIIDSIVVAKDSFIDYIPLPPECGSIKRTKYGYQFVNEIGDKMFYSICDTMGSARIYSKDKEGDQWGDRHFVEALGDPSNYPFLMADGVTLYFSHKGSESIGGYDIFVTRYDDVDNTYLKPQNIGFPFNSTANDYLYIVDEIDSLGWFVTDRRQPAGRVCIYTFVPSPSRENLSIERDGAALVRSRAAIHSISETWVGNYTELALAEKRLKRLKEHKGRPIERKFKFHINDDVTYTDIEQFTVPENKKRIQQIHEMEQMLAKNEKELEEARIKYRQANRFDRTALGSEILKAEKEVEQLRADIKATEKKIRIVEVYESNQSEPVATTVSVTDGKISFSSDGLNTGSHSLFVQVGNTKSNTISVTILAKKIQITAVSKNVLSGAAIEFSVSFENFIENPDTLDVYESNQSDPVATGVSVTDGKISFSSIGLEAGSHSLFVQAGNTKSNTKSVTILAKKIQITAVSENLLSGAAIELSVSFENFIENPGTLDVYESNKSEPVATGVSVTDGKISFSSADRNIGSYNFYVKTNDITSNIINIQIVKKEIKLNSTDTSVFVGNTIDIPIEFLNYTEEPTSVDVYKNDEFLPFLTNISVSNNKISIPLSLDLENNLCKSR